MKKYWCLCLTNYVENENNNDVLYFENYETALENFNKICDNHKNFDDFEVEENFCSWYEEMYDFPTQVELLEMAMPTIQKMKMLF